MRSLVGKQSHAAQGVQERGAVDCQLVGVLLGYGGVVVGVFAVHQAADDVEIVEGEECVGVVVLQLHLRVLLTGCQDVTHHHNGLAGEDELHFLLAMNVGAAIAHQFVGVGGDKGGVLGVDFAIDAAHLGAHLVGRSCECGLADGAGECAACQCDGGSLLGFGHIGESLGVVSGKVVFAFARRDADAEVAIVDAESHGHIVHALHNVEQQFRRHCNVRQAFHAASLHLNLRNQSGFQVGSTDGQHPFVQMEVEAVDDRHGVAVGQHAAQRLDLFGKQQAVNDEFHIFISFCYLIITKCKDIVYFSYITLVDEIFINNVLKI